MNNIILLPTARGAATPLDLFLRVGEKHHGQIAGLHDEGRLPLRRANCCRSLADMIKNSKRHSFTQKVRAMETLHKTPDLMRTQHFPDVELAEVDRFGRQVKDLKPVVSELKPRGGQTAEQAAENLVRRLTEHAQRNEKMRSSLENLHSVRGLDLPRAPAAHLSPRARASSEKR